MVWWIHSIAEEINPRQSPSFTFTQTKMIVNNSFPVVTQFTNNNKVHNPPQPQRTTTMQLNVST